ncbi:hypothetical protein KCU88_g2532, partial [Aureobasidium melanogenum]
MSYQQFLQSTGLQPTAGKTTSSPGSLHRKPPSASGSPSIHSAVTRNAPLTSHSTKAPSFSSPTPSSTNSPAPPTRQPPPPPPSTTQQPSPATTTTQQPSTATAAQQLTQRTPLTKAQIDTAMQTCLDLQNTATTIHSKRPFAALLLGPDNTTVLLTHFSISAVQRAETELARLASLQFSPTYLNACTLVSTWEPCPMCIATIYYSNIGRVVYAASASRLEDLVVGDDRPLFMPCRDVLGGASGKGQKDIEIIGPLEGWEDTVVEASRSWWQQQQLLTGEDGANAQMASLRLREGSVNGSEKPASLSSTSVRQGTPVTWVGEDSVLSSIDDEGEYKAELDIDWMR